MPIARTSVILAVLFTLGLGHILFFEPRLMSTGERRAAEKRVVSLIADEVQRIKIRRDHWTSILLERAGPRSFRMVEPTAAAAQSSLVSRLLSTIEFLEKRATFDGHRQEGQGRRDYGLDPPQIEISLAAEDGREIHLAVGKESAMGKGIYLQVLGEDAINVVSAKLSTIANRLLDVSLGEDERNTERSQTQ